MGFSLTFNSLCGKCIDCFVNLSQCVTERTEEVFRSICKALLQNVVITGIGQTVVNRYIPGKTEYS